MTTRRALLVGAPTTLLAAPSAFAQALGEAGVSGGDLSALERLMAQTLKGELGDEALAHELAAHVADAGFRWGYPMFPVREADSVVAYSFGYRSATGKVNPDTGLTDGEEAPEPGPINAMLADAVQAIRRLRKVRVYAQWEIAQVLADRHGMKDVVPIYPAKGEDGRKTYLSTDGVARGVIAHAGTAQALGKVAVVGHRDHVKRCILVSRANGMAAAAAREVPLPVDYDPRSAQPWTRRRDAYLLSDVIAQLTMARARILSDLPG
ncbi:hypothetical protein [Novosphingobium sp. ST904]|uniref:hypothetical protein n=1 Tax=Novosphingobium sp. ST904 TaxID=1684385 RepID=UPI0006CCB2FD|nr:hypothetical protein [Novosphingobium sp. ST904]KPH66272.1 hypothetical protein ADT71_07075 [Novosphingobium sp. ST904]TCM38733.1 hypothetical protein EDF59_10740 [Novosphingobium sp. ST904]